MRKAIVLFCFILLVGSVAPSEADGSSSSGRNTPALKNLSKGSSIGQILADAERGVKLPEEYILAARLIQRTKPLVQEPREWDVYGDDAFVLVDPPRDFPTASPEQLAEMATMVAFSLGDQFPIYVNVPMLKKKLLGPSAEELHRGDYDRVVAILSFTLAHELVHPSGGGELEALRVEERQLAFVERRRMINKEEAKVFRNNIRAEMRREELATVVSLNRP